MYKKYLEDNFFSSDNQISKFSGGLFNVDGKKNTMLVIKYQATDKNFYIRIVFISGDEVIESKDYKVTNINYLYNLET